MCCPGSQFLYAEGGGDEIRLAFTTHNVLVKGCGLSSLLMDFAARRVAHLHQEKRADRFAKGADASINELSVIKIEPHQ
jgi:hypothetical protein